MHTINLPSKCKGIQYVGLLHFVAERSSEFYLIDPGRIAANGQSPVASLQSYLIRQRNVDEWPGTRLGDGTGRDALRSDFAVSVQSLEALLRVKVDLYGWSGDTRPPLPEDLGFVRADGTVVLATISHERDAWLELKENDVKLFKSFADQVGLQFEIGEAPQR